MGLLILWVAVTGRYIGRFDPRRPSWLLLAALLIVWGIRRWWQRGRAAANSPFWQTSGAPWRQIGGASLSLAGLLMLSLAWARLDWANWLVMATGAVLILRGLAIAILVQAKA